MKDKPPSPETQEADPHSFRINRLSLHFHFNHFMFIHGRMQGLGPQLPTKLNGRWVMGLLRAQRHGAHISAITPTLLGIAHIGVGGHYLSTKTHYKQI